MLEGFVTIQEEEEVKEADDSEEDGDGSTISTQGRATV